MKRTIDRRDALRALLGVPAAIAVSCATRQRFRPQTAIPLFDVDSASVPAYTPETDPFARGSRLISITDPIRAMRATETMKLSALFNALRVGAETGLVLSENEDMARPPRTSEETLELGGTRTEMAVVAIAAVQELGLLGRAQLITLPSREESILVAYGVGEEGIFFIDPYSSSFGQRPEGAVLSLDVSIRQSASVYHALWGGYLSGQSPIDVVSLSQAYETAAMLSPADLSYRSILLEWGGDELSREEIQQQLAVIRALQENSMQPTTYSQYLLSAQLLYQTGVELLLDRNTSEARSFFTRCIERIQRAFEIDPDSARNAIDYVQLMIICRQL